MGERAKNFLNLVDSSEMACSLRHESIGGCPYNAFDHRAIAVLASASAALALVSLAIGI